MYRLTIHSLDNSFPRFRTAEFVLSSGQRLTLGRITIPDHGWLSCRVRCIGQIDLADVLAQIAPVEDPRDVVIHRIGADGQARWPLLAGRYSVTLYGGGIVEEIREVDVCVGKSEQLELVLRSSALIRGKSP